MGKSLYAKRKAVKREKRKQRLGTEVCSDCKKKFYLDKLYHGYCPFIEEVYGSKEAKKNGKVYLCDNCFHESVMDI